MAIAAPVSNLSIPGTKENHAEGEKKDVEDIFASVVETKTTRTTSRIQFTHLKSHPSRWKLSRDDAR